MSDLSPGLIQQVIDRLRAVAAPPSDHVLTPEEHAEMERRAGRRLPVGNMSEVDRMAAGLPPIQR